MNFFEKLQVGWWWILQIFEEWCYTMRSEDGEFFNYSSKHLKNTKRKNHKNQQTKPQTLYQQ
jgi:hypothetical protein